MSDLIVESHCREYLLLCSKTNRADKFKRVSKDTIEEVNALVDTVIRQIETKVPEPLHPLPPAPEALHCITGYALEKCRDRLEVAVRKIMANKVQHTPSKGITL
jgi:hypothetical protein